MTVSRVETEIEKETEIDSKPGGNGLEKETGINSKPGGNGVRKGDGN